MTLVIRVARPSRIGIALAPDRVTAVRIDGAAPPASAEAWSRPLDPAAGMTGLGSALEDLATELDLRRARISVALLPPLAELKWLALPRLARDELERVLARDASRYFLSGADGPTVVAVEVVRTREVGLLPMPAVAAQTTVLEELHQQVARRGWVLERIVPAYTAWVKAVHRLTGPVPEAWVAVAGRGCLDLLRLEAGRMTALRRLGLRRELADVAERVAAIARTGAVGPKAAPLVLVGAAPGLEEILRTTLAEPSTACPAVEVLSLASDPDVVAAWHAAQSHPLTLVPPSVSGVYRRRAAQLTYAAAGTAATLLLLAGALQWWGVARELDQVLARRRAIRAQVAQAVDVRSAIEALEERAVALRAAEAHRPGWTGALGTVATTLPADAHLIAWRADADSLRVEGLATRASGVFEALARMPGINAVRADAPIRQELRDSGPPLEHFLLSARVTAPRDAAPRRGSTAALSDTVAHR